MLTVVSLQLSTGIRTSQATQADGADAAEDAHGVSQAPAAAAAVSGLTTVGHSGFLRIFGRFGQGLSHLAITIEHPSRGNLSGVSTRGVVNVGVSSVDPLGDGLDRGTLKPEDDLTLGALLHPIHRGDQVQECPHGFGGRFRSGIAGIQGFLSNLQGPQVVLLPVLVTASQHPVQEVSAGQLSHDLIGLGDAQVGGELDDLASVSDDGVVHGSVAVGAPRPRTPIL